MKGSTKVLLIIVLIALFVLPLILQKGAEFGGADGEAAENIIIY